ncbi:MAG: hypothetical protein R3C18_13775 [Planctomycetaceae bacterium]
MQTWYVRVTVLVILAFGFLFGPRVYVSYQAALIADEYEHIVQAVADYHAETGLFPSNGEDLATRSGIEIPDNVAVSSYGDVAIMGEPVRVSYLFFAPPSEGWHCSYGRLSLPLVESQHDPVSGEARLEAALAEYDRRIEHYVDDQWQRSAKMALLADAGRTEQLFDECLRAREEYPDWWRGQLGAALFAPDDQRDAAEGSLVEWCKRSPGFIHYWYLAWYYRQVDQPENALEALSQAAKNPLEQLEKDAGRVPNWFAFDAVTYAGQHENPELVLALCEQWSHPQGIYTSVSRDIPAFRAAALLRLGRFEEAEKECDIVLAQSADRRLKAGNLNALAQAIADKDKTFVYDPGIPYGEPKEFSPFPDPEFDASDLSE